MTLTASLKLLSEFLATKSGQNVIVLIDEYEAPNNRACEFDFVKQVCLSIPFPITFEVDDIDPG